MKCTEIVTNTTSVRETRLFRTIHILYVIRWYSKFATFDFFPDKRFNGRFRQGQSKTTGCASPSNDSASPSVSARVQDPFATAMQIPLRPLHEIRHTAIPFESWNRYTACVRNRIATVKFLTNPNFLQHRFFSIFNIDKYIDNYENFLKTDYIFKIERRSRYPIFILTSQTQVKVLWFLQRTNYYLSGIKTIAIHLCSNVYNLDFRRKRECCDTRYSASAFHGDKWSFVPVARNVRKLAVLVTLEYKWSPGWNFRDICLLRSPGPPFVSLERFSLT